MIKAIFFDSGNVLVKEGFATGIAAYEKKHKIIKGQLYTACHDHDYWKEFTLGNISEKRYFQNVADNFAQPLNIKEVKKLMYQYFIPNHALLKFTQTLKKHYILGIISNNPKEVFDYFWKHYGWNKIFKVKSLSSELHIRKPDVRIFIDALSKAKAKGEEALYIDDRPERGLSAQELGINVMIYKNLTQLKKDIKKYL
jgi:putative hydrolase of the HAD superfamily